MTSFSASSLRTAAGDTREVRHAGTAPEMTAVSSDTRMVTSMTRRSRFPSSASVTSGWPAVLVGALGVGVVLAVSTRLCRRLGGDIAAVLYVFSVLPAMLRLDESWSAGALSGPIISAVYVIVLFTIAKGIDSGLFGARRNASEMT